MRIQVAVTGPARVVLGRTSVDLLLPGETCTLEELLHALAGGEPRISRYLLGEDGRPASSLRALLNDRQLDQASRIPNGAVVTLLYAVAGG